MRTKHIPQRTCIACRQIGPKRELARLVRGPSGNVEVDISGKKPGRGAYLCFKRSCWESGLKEKRLEHFLRISLAQENRERLMEYAKSLTGDDINEKH